MSFRSILLVVFSLLFLQLSADRLSAQDTTSPVKSNSPKHLKYFGFTLIDVGWDDPNDNEKKTVYLDEVAPFSNMGDLLVVAPQDNIIDRLQAFTDHEMKAVIHLNEIFFERVNDKGPSGSNYDLRDDFRKRWDQFIAVNKLKKDRSSIQAFYAGEEPTWNGITFDELKQATDYIKTTVPDVPVMVVEAYPAIKDLKVPESVDWLGFDHYFKKDPSNDEEFQAELKLLKSKRSTKEQKIILIPDAHFFPKIHNHFGVQRKDMKSIATAYFEIASNDKDIVALLGYFWPSGFDDLSTEGARQLPIETQQEYERIGKLITGK